MKMALKANGANAMKIREMSKIMAINVMKVMAKWQ
jgi:hypothetical protein